MSIFSVSVRLSTVTLSVEDLSRLAGTSPTGSFTKGDRISLRLPPDKVRKHTWWSKQSEVTTDTWTLEPHWPSIAPILESLSQHDLTGVDVTLAIGTNSRDSGYAFDLEPHHVALLARVGAGVWIDSYEANRDHDDRPDDYPFNEGLRPPGPWRRFRRAVNLGLRKANPFGKVRRHRKKEVNLVVANWPG